MESADLNPKPSDDASLEKMLRVHFNTPSLPDDGFSGRVLQALPSRAVTAAPIRRSLKPWLCLVGAGAGLLLVRFELPQRGSLADSFLALTPELNASLAAMHEPAVYYALFATVASLLFVYWRPLLKRLLRA